MRNVTEASLGLGTCQWNVAGLYGPFAELYFLLMKKEFKSEPVPLLEKPTVKHNYRQLFGFDAVDHMSFPLRESFSAPMKKIACGPNEARGGESHAFIGLYMILC